MRKIIFGGLFGFLALFLVVSRVFASDGTLDIVNRVGADARCWASTVLMQDQNYKVLLSCRDITYPGGNEVFYYVVWSNPASGGNPERLGSLGLGKAEFQTRNEFVSMFITKEKSANANTPSGTIVMQGGLKPVSLLQEVGKDTATNSGSSTSSDQTVEMTPLPTAQPRTGIAKFLTSGILAVVGLGGLIFVVFIITKR